MKRKSRSPYFQEVLELAGIFHEKRAFTGPRIVQIDVTNNCDNECILCWAWTPFREDERMIEGFLQWARAELPVNLVKDLIHELAEMGVELVHFAGGGEPFIHPKFIDIIRLVKRLGLQCKITTNFTRVDSQLVKELVDLRIDYMTLSFWAASEETYLVMHPRKKAGTFTQITENLSQLFALRKQTGKPWIRIYNVISKLNYHEIEKMYDFALAVGVDAIEYQIVDPLPGKTDQFLLSHLEAEHAIQLVDRVKEKHNKCEDRNIDIIWLDSFRRRLETKEVVTGKYDKEIIDRIPCYIAWSFARVLANGDVSSCLKSDRTPIGNIHTHKFKALWNSPKQQEFRYNVLHLKKSDPYFSQTFCYKTCDHFGDNVLLQRKLEKKLPSLYFKDRSQIALAKSIAFLSRLKR